MKHTPGPWYVRQDREFYTNHVQPFCIATMPENEFDEDIWICRCMDMWDEEMKANAKLIAAAPELLDALMELQKQLHNHYKMNVKKDYSLLVADSIASKVIHKATRE